MPDNARPGHTLSLIHISTVGSSFDEDAYFFAQAVCAAQKELILTWHEDVGESLASSYLEEIWKLFLQPGRDVYKRRECQVFGFAPTQIIYDITMSYIFGFDEGAKNISRRNFFCEDTLPYAERGELQKLVNEKLADRVK